jgi:hypothetical protein
MEATGAGYVVGDELRVARASLGGSPASAGGFAMRVTALANLEGVTIDNADDVTFSEDVIVEGDIHIHATGTVRFDGELLLLNGGSLFINGADEVIFSNGMRLQGGGAAGRIELTGSGTSVSAANGLWTGDGSSFVVDGVTQLSATANSARSAFADINIDGGDLSISAATGQTSVVLPADTDIAASDQLNVNIATGSFSTSSDTTLAANSLSFDVRDNFGASSALVQVSADTIDGRSQQGSIYLDEDSGTEISISQLDGVTADDINLAIAAGGVDIDADGSIALGRIVAGGDISVTAGGAIKNTSATSMTNLETPGKVSLNAQSGVGGFGSARLLISAGELTVSNTQSGDVVLAGASGLNVGAAGVKSQSSDGYVVLLSGSGSVTGSTALESGNGYAVAVRSGVTMISRESFIASLIPDGGGSGGSGGDSSNGSSTAAATLESISRTLQLLDMGLYGQPADSVFRGINNASPNGDVGSLLRSRGSVLGGMTLADIAADDKLAGADMYRQSTTFLAMALQAVQKSPDAVLSGNETLPNSMNRAAPEADKSAPANVQPGERRERQEKQQKQDGKQQKQDGKQQKQDKSAPADQKGNRPQNKAGEIPAEKRQQMPESDQDKGDQPEEINEIEKPIAALDGADSLPKAGITNPLSGLMRRLGDWLDSQVAQPATEAPEKDGVSSQVDQAASVPDKKSNKSS